MNPWGACAAVPWTRRPGWLQCQDKVRRDLIVEPSPDLAVVEPRSLSETSHRENNALAVFNLSPITPKRPWAAEAR